MLIPVGPGNIEIVIPLSNLEISSFSASVGRRLNGPVWRELAELWRGQDDREGSRHADQLTQREHPGLPPRTVRVQDSPFGRGCGGGGYRPDC